MAGKGNYSLEQHVIKSSPLELAWSCALDGSVICAEYHLSKPKLQEEREEIAQEEREEIIVTAYRCSILNLLYLARKCRREGLFLSENQYLDMARKYANKLKAKDSKLLPYPYEHLNSRAIARLDYYIPSKT